MASFEDTKLLRHPTVEKAYHEMRKFFQDGDDYAAHAVRVGELITAYAKNPDPDLIAACVLLDGMIIPYRADSFAATVSPGAAECLGRLMALDPDTLQGDRPDEKLAVLAHAVLALDELRSAIAVPDFWDYRTVKIQMDRLEKGVLHAAEDTDEIRFAIEAVDRLERTQATLAGVVAQRQAALSFEKSGLPEHPLVRQVYDFVKDDELRHHPLGGRMDFIGDAARLIVDLGASQDPEVLAATLLNQFHDKKKEIADISTPRVAELYLETSPWSYLGRGKAQDDMPGTLEGNIIRHAFHLSVLEEHIDYCNKVLSAKEGVEKIYRIQALEDLESRRNVVAGALEGGIVCDAFAPRMRKGVETADRIMHARKNVRIRKPGSPEVEGP